MRSISWRSRYYWRLFPISIPPSESMPPLSISLQLKNIFIFAQIFSRISYSLWKGILIDIINILSTFSWNFVDLFLILISIALADQFRQLNSRLYSIRGKVRIVFFFLSQCIKFLSLILIANTGR